MKSRFAFVACVVLALFWTTESAHAYIDPGSGSIFLQMLLGGVAGVAVLAKVYWNSFRARIGFPASDAEGPDDNPAQ